MDINSNIDDHHYVYLRRPSVSFLKQAFFNNTKFAFRICGLKLYSSLNTSLIRGPHNNLVTYIEIDQIELNL